MSKSEAFLWGGVISLFVGLVGTGVSTYFVVTSKDNDPNATTKKVGLSMSVVVAVIGIILMIYYYKGGSIFNTGDSTCVDGTCPVASAVEQAADQAAQMNAAAAASASIPNIRPGSNSIHIHMDQK